MNRTAWAKPADMPIKAPKMATAMTATSKTVIPSCSIAPIRSVTYSDLLGPTRTYSDLLALFSARPLEGPIGRLEARHKVGQMLDFVNGDALAAQRRRRASAAARHQRTAEAELGRLTQPGLALTHRP